MLSPLARFVVLSVAACSETVPAAAANAPPPAPPGPAADPCAGDVPPDDDDYYGVYLNGAKVGWMRTQSRRDGDRYTTSTDLDAAVGGLGRVSNIELRESRTYEVASGRLASLHFSQGAQTGRVEVHGAVTGDTLELSISAGGASQKQRIAVQESLADAARVWRLACAGRGEATVRHFDPSVQKTLAVHYRVVGREERLLAGVKAAVLRIDSEYPELGVKESSWVDGRGRILETQVAGFFVARLEPPEVAKRLDYSQDILISAVVKIPEPIAAPENLGKLRLVFTGFGEQLPPSSPPRQRVERKGDRVQLDLERDAPPPVTPLAKPLATQDPDLAPTPFIQSDAPAIARAAQSAIGDARDLRTASARLAAWVYEHVRDEYVPSYSNALEALESGRGDCTEHAVLFVAMARALAIPARVAVGIAYWPPGGGFGWHAWAEIRAGDRWLAVDPTWNQPVADATHVKLAAGDPAEQARIVMLLGQLRIVDIARP